MPTEDSALKTKLQKFFEGLNPTNPIEQAPTQSIQPTQPKPDPFKALNDYFQKNNIQPLENNENEELSENAEPNEYSSFNPFKDFFQNKKTKEKNKERGYKSFSEKYLNHISEFIASLNTSFISSFIQKNQNDVLYKNAIQRLIFVLSAFEELKAEANKTPYFVLKKFNDIYFALDDCKKILKSITGKDWPEDFENFFNKFSEEFRYLNIEILDKNNRLLSNDIVTQITNQSRKFISNRVFPVYSPKRNLDSNLRINMEQVLSGFFDKALAKQKTQEIMSSIENIISKTGLTGAEAESIRNDIYKDFSNELLKPDTDYDSLKHLLKQSEGVASSFLNLKDLSYLSEMKDIANRVIERPEELFDIVEKSKIQSNIKVKIKAIMAGVFKEESLYESFPGDPEKIIQSLEDAEYDIDMLKKESINKDSIFDVCLLIIKKFMGKLSGGISNPTGGMSKNKPELTSFEGSSNVSNIEHGNANVKYQVSPEGREANRRSSLKSIERETPQMREERLRKIKERKEKMQDLDSFISLQAEKAIRERNKIISLIKDNDLLELTSFLEEIFVRVQSFLPEVKSFIKNKFPELDDTQLDIGSYKRLDTIKNQAIRSDENILEFVKITPENQMKNKKAAISLLENHIKKLQSIFIKRRTYNETQSKASILADFFYKTAVNYINYEQ